MDNIANFYSLIKAEDPAAYKKLAEQGVMVGFPATIAGNTHRKDIGIPYHSTIKFFNPEKDKPHHIHGIAEKLNLTPPDPKHTSIEPGKLKDRVGNDVYVIKLHGENANTIKEHNKKFSHMGYPQNFEYQPHISVDKATWDKIVSSKAKTAHEAGISFGPAQLRHGHKVLATYKSKPTKESDHEKLAASEKNELEAMEKGFLKHMGVAAGMASALATSSPAKAPIQEAPQYSSQKMLNAISQVESSGGKNENHKELGGMHHGEHAYGKYGLTPVVIRETIHLNPDLKQKYGKASRLQGNDMQHFMQDNPALEDLVAKKHLSRLEHHFGTSPQKLAYSWLNGVQGTYKAIKEKKDIDNHWHVKKVKDAYLRSK